MAIVELTQKSLAKLKADTGRGQPRYEVRDSRQPNLVLRVGARGVRWQLRLSQEGKERRLDIGGIDDWSIAEARELGSRASSLLKNRTGTPDHHWLHARRIEYRKIQPDEAGTFHAPLPNRNAWTFAKARDEYLDDVKRTLRPATYDDYLGMLNIQELKPIEKMPVCEIDRIRMSKIVGAIHASGRERHAEHLASIIRPMWAWLADDIQIGDSGVAPDAMVRLRAPRRSRDDWAVPGYVPPMEEVGRIIAIARAHVLEPSISYAVELMAFTAQRRLTVVSARKCDFEATNLGGVWSIPSAFMKSGRKGKRKREFHVVPLPKHVWSIVEKAIQISHTPDSEWLFPQFRPKKAGGPVSHLSASTLTRALLLMPDITASPHDLRRAFATHGEKRYGLKRSDTQAILDHGEGEQGSDVTAMHYALHDGSHFKWPVMERWRAVVEPHVALAIEADPRLADRQWLKAQIDQARYGE